jgi:hypothetical protein
MMAWITPVNIMRLITALGFLTMVVILVTVDPHPLWRVTVTYQGWLLIKTAAYIGVAATLWIAVEHAFLAIPFGLKLIRQGREMRKKSVR